MLETLLFISDSFTSLQRFHFLSDNLKGATVLLIAAFGFSVMLALIKLTGERLPISQILLVRQLVMTAIVFPLIRRDFPASMRTTRPFLHLIRVVLALLAMVFGFTAIVNIPLADATALGFARSFFVTIFAVVLLKETVGKHRWSAVVVGFLGVLLMLQPGTDAFSIYGLCAVVGAAAAGCVMVILRIMSRTEPSNTILAYQAIGVGLIMTIPAAIQWVRPTFTEWLLLISILHDPTRITTILNRAGESAGLDNEHLPQHSVTSG